MSKILKLNRWVLIGLTFLFPMVWNIIFGFDYPHVELGISIFWITTLIIWFCSVDIFLQLYFESKNVNNLIILKYIFLFIYPITFRILSFPYTVINADSPLFYYILPLQLLYLFVYLSTVLKISRHILKHFSISNGFWKLLFFPLGIYLIQPVLNNAVKTKHSEKITTHNTLV